FLYEGDLARILTRISKADSGWYAQAMPMGLAAEIASNPVEAAHFDGFASVHNLKGEAERSLLSLVSSRDNFYLGVNSEVRSLLGTGTPGTVTGVRLTD